MKRLIAVLMCCVFAIVMMGCAAKDGEANESVKATSAGTEKVESEANNETLAAVDETEVLEDEVFVGSDSNVLVVYFSRTGNTKQLAEYAADYCSADLFEIKAKVPYTDEDIDYGNSDSRTSIEQNDKSVRPEIANSISDISQYHVVILAYPIWWGQAPRIIDTFLESYDFTNKTIIPFCTSASSDIGSSDDELHALTSDKTIWAEGKRFAAGTSEETLIAWLEGYLY